MALMYNDTNCFLVNPGWMNGWVCGLFGALFIDGWMNGLNINNDDDDDEWMMIDE